MASIVTRKNSFAVVYMTTVNGVRKQKWETYHTLPEAVRRKEQLERYHDLRKSKKIGGEVETVAQLMSVYLRLHGVPRWSPSTYRSNCGLIQHYILPCMGNMRLSELSPRTVAALYSRMLEEPRISLLTTSRADRSCLPPRYAASTKCFTAPLNRQSFGSMWTATHSIGHLCQPAGRNRRHFWLRSRSSSWFCIVRPHWRWRSTSPLPPRFGKGNCWL